MSPGYTDSADVTRLNIYFQLSGQKTSSTSLSLKRQLCVFNIPGFPGTYLWAQGPAFLLQIITELGDIVFELLVSNRKNKRDLKNKKNEEKHKSFEKPFKISNIQIIGVLEGDKIQVGGIENLFHKITAGNSPNLGQEVFWTTNTHDQKSISWWDIIVKLLKIQDKECNTIYKIEMSSNKGKYIRLTEDFSQRTIKCQEGTEWCILCPERK